MKRAPLAAASVVAALALVSCSSDDGEPSSTPPATDAVATTSAPVDIARDLVDAWATGDAATACDLQTKRHIRNELTAYVNEGSLPKGSTCEDLTRLIASVYADGTLDPNHAAFSETSNDGTVAYVVVSWPPAARAQPGTLVLRNTPDGWRVDNMPE